MDPKFDTDPPRTLREMEQRASEAAIPGAFQWLEAGSEYERTIQANRAAFDRVAIRPRVFRDVSAVNPRTRLFGVDLGMPAIISPLGHLTQFHEDGEAELAAGTEGEETILCISTQTRISLPEIRERAKDTNLLWQVYFYGPREWVAEQVRIATDCGVVAICVCGDAPTRPVRYRDREARYDGRDHGRRTSTPVPSTLTNASTSWEDFAWLRDITDLPVIVKGVMTREDAELSVKYGADAVWVSNHGGRQLDSGLASMDVLPEVRDAIGSEMPLILDGGVRTGGDMVRALAAGADCVGIGRLAAYGLMAGGAAGVHKMLELLREEFISAMQNAGIVSIGDMSSDCIRPVS